MPVNDIEFSIVIPTHNRPTQLATCLTGLAKLDFPRERFEVIVVDDGGDRDLSSIIQQFQNRIDVKLTRQSNAGPAAARNTGVAAATRRFLAFTDDDCTPHSDWLNQFAKAFAADEEIMVGGTSINALKNNLCAAASQVILNVVHLHFNRDHEHAIFFPSNNLALKREKYLELGGFDPAFRCSEDRDLCDRWLASGKRLVFVPQAKIDHAHEMGLIGFWRQHVGYGRGAWRFHTARKLRNTGRLEVDGSFYRKCLKEAMAIRPLTRAVKLTVMMGVWQIANAVGFFCEGTMPRRQPEQSASPAEARESA